MNRVINIRKCEEMKQREKRHKQMEECMSDKEDDFEKWKEQKRIERKIIRKDKKSKCMAVNCIRWLAFGSRKDGEIHPHFNYFQIHSNWLLILMAGSFYTLGLGNCWYCTFDHVEYSVYRLPLQCYTHNVPADRSFGLLLAFHVELGSLDRTSN